LSKETETQFEGFSPRLFQFLTELQANNNREWFAENKSRYEEDLLKPSLAFVRAIAPGLRRLSPYLQAIPKRMGGSLMRIYRDTRFSNNKDPYKNNVGIHFRHELGGDIHAPGYYLHLQTGECFTAAGIWMPPTEPLSMIRTAIVEDPSYWKRVRDNKKFIARFRLDGESLKTAPRGFDPTHKMIEDLRRKSFAGVAKIDQAALSKASCVDEVLRTFSDAKPLMKYLCDALHQPF